VVTGKKGDENELINSHYPINDNKIVINVDEIKDYDSVLITV
jgi:hypothetical protein